MGCYASFVFFFWRACAVGMALGMPRATSNQNRLPWIVHTQAQIDANVRVISNSKGMLAPVKGTERVLSLGTGHCAAFCRAANAGCKTPIQFIRDSSGAIDIVSLKRQKHFKEMLEVGWKFWRLSWMVEDAWPGATHILQAALNSTNDIGNSPSELEGAVSIAERLANGESLQDATNAAVSTCPPWKGYVAHLASLAKYYGGGSQVPKLYQLDAFAKKYGENRRLGEEFLGAIMALKWPGDLEYPRIVDAWLTTNMVSPKVVDGVARCLTKSDIGSCTAKTKAKMIADADRHLEQIADVCKAVKGLEIIKDDAVETLEGLGKVRTGAFICNKSKMTFEAKEFENLHDIVRLFLKELTEALGSNVGKMPAISQEWIAIVSATTEKKEESQQAPALPELMTDQDLMDKEAIANRKGYAVNDVVFERSVGAKQGLYTIVAINDLVSVKERDPFKETHLQVKVPFDVFLSKWAVFKGDAPSRVSGDWSGACAWLRESAELEEARAALSSAMREYASEAATAEPGDVVLCLKPTGLRAKRDFARGDLCLVPYVGMSNISDKSKPHFIDSGHTAKIDGRDVKLYLMKPSQPSAEDVNKWKEDEVVNPYFWVGSTANESEANMVHRKATEDGVSFSVLTNRCMVKSMELLQVFKPAIIQAPLQGAVEAKPSEEVEPKAGGKGRRGAQPPAKKARGKGTR